MRANGSQRPLRANNMRNRFHAICPYFAMFPESFAEHWIDRLTKPGDVVLDPFCGRGTAPFQALLMGRIGVGNDINPVAFCLTKAKLAPPVEASVLRRVQHLARIYDTAEWQRQAALMPDFFRAAFSPKTLGQVLFLREVLRWRTSKVDAMVAAITLGVLHGESQRYPTYLSNQMPRTISTKPDYSLRFWAEHGFVAPERDAFELLLSRASYRYESEINGPAGVAINGDVRELPRARLPAAPKCVITSPPYLNVTDYGEDQWLRLWFLGGVPRPTRGIVSRVDRHRGADNYWRLIADVWRALSQVLAPRSSIVIRLGGKNLEPEQLVTALTASSVFASRRVKLVSSETSEIMRRQTDAFRPGTTGCRYEIDAHFSMV